MNSMTIFVIVFVGTLLIGVPIVWSMSLASIIACMSLPGMSINFLAQKMEAGAEKYALLAIFSSFWQAPSCSTAELPAD